MTTMEGIVEEIEGLIEKLGISLRSGTDFKILDFLVKTSDRETPMDPIFLPAQSDIEQTGGIWLLGQNDEGDIVQTQAMRLLDLGDGTLADYLDSRIHEIRPHGYLVDCENTRWRLSPKASRISGKVLYHGGLWIRKDCRGGSITSLVTRYLLAKAVLELQPDYFVGLQAPFISCRGLAAREGYMHLEQHCILWKLQGKEEIFEDWLVWMDREDAEFNLAMPPQTFVDMFEKPSMPTPAAAKTGTGG